MTPVDILIPPPENSYSSEAAAQAQGYVEAFARAGIALRPLAWTDPEAGRAPALALLAWGYHYDLPRWLNFLDTGPPNALVNPAELRRWNTRKTYLAELDAAGVPTVPPGLGCQSGQIQTASSATRTADRQNRGLGGSYQTYRLTCGDVLHHRQALIQPFLPAIAEEGEFSLFYIGGALTHAIVKRATGGDFRIQPQFGGLNERWAPDAEALSVAQAALGAAPLPAVYARVDLLRRLDGRLALIEFEAIEPDLYVHHGEGVLEGGSCAGGKL